ncbi:MAG TPA: serine protease, partial [Pyrinomonadaceae bacterium]|nr:serine protease [Pyrinomonadaceae bacterium]
AAHLVQAADRTVVEFSPGELIPARVTGSAFSADVALLQLERNPMNAVAATLGDSDKVDVGDQIFVVGVSLRSQSDVDCRACQRSAYTEQEK